jgi:hypothetical protein
MVNWPTLVDTELVTRLAALFSQQACPKLCLGLCPKSLLGDQPYLVLGF